MKVICKLSNKDIDNYLKEYFAKENFSFILISCVLVCLAGLLSYFLNNYIVLLFSIIFIIIIDITYILIMKIRRKKISKLYKKENINYTYIFNNESLIIKTVQETNVYPYKDFILSILKSFLRLEYLNDIIFIIPKNKLSENELKEIKSHFKSRI